MNFPTALVSIVAAGLMGAAACTGTTSMPTPSSCGGIAAVAGGCRDDLPVFAGTDCATIGREFGRYLNAETVAIIKGPDNVDDERKSVRLKQALVLFANLANQRLRSLDLQATCDAPEFVAAARTEFSTALQAGVGAAMYDGNPVVPYEEWLRDLDRTISVIDTEE